MSVFNRQAQRHFQSLTAQLTATEGPLRLALNELNRFGIGERIVKSALAATIAWLVADQIPRENAPFVAALTAVYTMDLTILKSLRAAGQRLAGIALGIGMAFLAAEFLGVHSWSFQGHPIVWHSGAIDGFQSHLVYLSDEDIAIAAVTNGFPAPAGGDPYLIAVAIVKAALAVQ